MSRTACLNLERVEPLLVPAAEEDDEFEVFAIQGEYMPRSTQRGHAISERLVLSISAQALDSA